MSGWIYLLIALGGGLMTVNAARPSRKPSLLVVSWLAAFLTTDLAPFHILAAGVVSVAFAWGGALGSLPGQIALLIVVVSSIRLLVLWLPNRQAAAPATALSREFEFDPVTPVSRKLMLTPFKRVVDGVAVERDIEFSRPAGRRLALDIYRSRNGSDRRPLLLYLHGGGWIVGDKSNQGLPLCNHMAELGWVCANANYRLSPAATWPDHVIDAKTAIAWLRDNADVYGIDPDFVAIAGGSAGAHIAAMAALTDSDPALKPGFETADTSIQAAATFYGVYDLTNRLGAHHPDFLTKMLGPYVIKAFPDTEPERFSAASPRDHVGNVSQPWLILQGDRDTLTPAVEARDFRAALAEASSLPVGYLELPGAQHAFDIYYSPRAIAAVETAARFLVTAHRRAGEARREHV
jgi:acetyl esterase/lipase